MDFAKSILTTSILSTLIGCTSYTGHKLDSTGELPAGTTGIPFVMTRPEYSVDISPDPEDPTKSIYTLRSTNVPDPSQRYTIALAPSFLVDGSYELIYGDKGNITSSWTQSTSKVVATIESVVSYGLDKAMSNALLDAGTSWGTYQGIIDSSAEPDCTKTYKSISVKDSIITTMEELTAEAQYELGIPNTGKLDPANTLAASRFHYHNEAQRLCLIAITDETDSHYNQAISKAKNDYDSERLKVGAAISEPGDRRWLSLFEEAVNNSDEASVKALTGSAPKSAASLPALATTLLKDKESSESLRLMGNFYANMSLDIWKARHLEYLESKLEVIRLSKLVATKGNPPPGYKDPAKEIENEWIATLGAQKLISRIAKLDAFLSQIQITSDRNGGPPRYAASEFVTIREERDKLQKEVDGLRENVLSKNKLIDTPPKKSKIEPRTDISVALVTKEYIDQINKHPGTHEKLPEFVLVLEHIPTTTIQATPPLSSTTEK